MGPLPPSASPDLYTDWADEAYRAGGDWLFLETQTRLDMALESLQPIHYAVCPLPVIVSFVTNTNGTHLLGCGTPLVQAVAQTVMPNVVAIGINCVLPSTLARALPVLLGANRPLVLRPSAQTRQIRHTIAGEGEPYGELTPYTWAKSVAGLWNFCRIADVPCLVGGCCGAGPNHIAALRHEINRLI
jgi:S-methylmethionine-dependent homocysteine/selenocysteine methylase